MPCRTATGGAVGPYLEHTCGSADELFAAYEKLLDTVGTNHLSVDVLKDAAAKGVDVLVNPMLMNFGYTGDWELR